MTGEEAIRKLLTLKGKRIPVRNVNGCSGYIGRYLEDFLGIEENNRNSSDLEDMELKTHNEDSDSKVTLFTKSPSGRGKSKEIFESCSYDTEEGRKFMGSVNTSRVSNIKNKSYNLIESEDGFAFSSLDTNVNAIWEFDKIKRTFNRKMNKGIIIVNYRVITSNNETFIEITNIVKCINPNGDSMIESIRKGYTDIEFRFGQYLSGKNAGKMHNHGVAFRINESRIPYLFLEANIY